MKIEFLAESLRKQNKICLIQLREIRESDKCDEKFKYLSSLIIVNP